MTTERMDLELKAKIETEGTQKLTELDKILQKIQAAQEKINSTIGRATNGPGKAAKEALEFDRDRLRVLKMQMGYQKRERDDAARELRAQQREEERGIERAGRLRAQEHRRAMADARELTRERDRAARQIRQGAGQVRQGMGRTVGTGAAIAAASGYAAQRVLDSITRTAVTIDDAMNQSMIHIFGSQDTKTAQKSAADLRKKMMPVAARLGVRTADMISATVEAAQAGVEDHLLDVAVEQGTKFAKMNKLNVPDVLEQSGYAFQGLKAFGQVTNETIKRYYDESAYLIATTSANRKELLSFTRTGLASGASVGMNMEETLAFGGAVTAAGGEGQQASRMLSSQGTRIADWRNRGRNINQKHHRNAEDRQFMDAVQILGFRNSDAMADAFSKDFFGSLVDAQDKLKGISDPLKRKSITGQLFGKEFGALIDSMIMGGNMRDFRSKLDGAGGYLNKSWSKFTTNLGFIIDKIGVVLGNLTDTLSLGLKPLYADLSDWIDRLPASFDGFNSAFQSGIYGFLKGLGSEDGSLGSLLNKVLGDPAQFRLDAGAFLRFGQGFGEGLRAVARSVMSVIRTFTGADADPAKIGRWTAEFLAVSAALVAASPAIIAMSGIATAVGGFTTALVGAWGLMKAAGIVAGGGAATAGATAGGAAPGAAAAGGGIIARILGMFGGAVGFNATAGLSKSDQNSLTQRLGAWAAQREGKPLGGDGHWQDVGPSKRLAEMRESLIANTEAVKKNTQATQDDARKAAEFKAKEAADAEKRRLDQMLVGIRNPGMTGSVGGGSSTADELRSRGFNPTTPNTVPNGANGNMPTANGGQNDGHPDQKSGGSRSWRNNNPGNIEYGPFARSMGAIGTDGRFAKFPSYEAGRKAQEKLLFESKGYRDLTLSGAIRRWAPASENNVPAYLRAMGGDPGKRMSEYTPEQRGRLLDAMQAHEGWRPGTVAGGGSTGTGGSALPGAGQSVALDSARGLLGASSRQAAAALGRRMSPGQWCADFVSGALAKADIKGIQGSIANSYLGWGQRVTDGVKPGDVVVTHRGQGVGKVGGHVGLATGQTRMKNGRLQYQTISGNHGNAVGEGWEYRDRVEVRRAVESMKATQDLAAGINKPTTAGRGLGDQGAAPKPITDQFGNRLGESVPTRSGITGRVPDAALRSPRGGGGSGNVQVHIGQINGGGDPKAIGDEVGRRTREAMNNATHDVDPGGFA